MKHGAVIKAVLFVGLCLALATSAQAAVTILDAMHSVQIIAGVDSVDATTMDAEIPPVDTEVLAEGYGHLAMTQLNRSQAAFHYALTQSLSVSDALSLAVNGGYDWFTVSVPTYFTVSGQYALNGAVDRIAVDVWLYNATEEEGVFLTSRSSFEPNAVLTWHETGLLLPHRRYELNYNASIFTLEGNSEAASTSGHVQIEFSPVPEPNTLLVWAILGLLGVIFRRRGD